MRVLMVFEVIVTFGVDVMSVLGRHGRQGDDAEAASDGCLDDRLNLSVSRRVGAVAARTRRCAATGENRSRGERRVVRDRAAAGSHVDVTREALVGEVRDHVSGQRGAALELEHRVAVRRRSWCT